MSPQLQTLPHLVVEADNELLPLEELRTLWAVRVQQRLSLPTLCELTFIEPTVALTRTEIFSPGSHIRISVPGFEEVLFSGQVTAIEHIYEPSHGREIRIRGYDTLHRLRKRQPVRAHVEMSLVDLISEIVADLGVTVEAAVAGPKWQRLVQFRQSDFEIIAEVAERAGLYFTLRDDTLHVLTLAGIGEDVTLQTIQRAPGQAAGHVRQEIIPR